MARSPLAVAIIASIVTVIAGEVMTGMQGIAAFLYEHITIGWKR